MFAIISAGAGSGTDRTGDGDAQGWTFRSPGVADGRSVSALVADCPPLDVNSPYCNLLQCTDFADTCVIAERAGEVLGWISAYRPPSHPDRLFVWQVAVAEAARGEGLAGRMLDWLIAQPSAVGVQTLTTTITTDNAASWSLFARFAERHGADFERVPRFDRDLHFGGVHGTEWEARIAPLPTP